MVKAKHEKPCIYEKEGHDNLRAGVETMEILVERHENPKSEKIKYVVKKVYKPEHSKAAEESVKIWEILERNDFNVPAYYFLTEEDGHKVIYMEFLGEEGKFVESFSRAGSVDILFRNLDNFRDLAQKTIEDLARMHRLNISIAHTPLSPWFLKVNKIIRKGELFLGDLSNLQLNDNLSISQREKDLKDLIKDFDLMHNFSFEDSSLDPEKIYRDAYESFEPKEVEKGK